MTVEPSMVVLGPGEGVRIESPIGEAITFKARGSETGGTMTAFETIVAVGEGPPLHVHANEDEAVYVLEGDLHFRVGLIYAGRRPERSCSFRVGLRTRSRTSVAIRPASS